MYGNTMYRINDYNLTMESKEKNFNVKNLMDELNRIDEKVTYRQETNDQIHPK
jgi:hypothetical protein